MDSVKDVRKEYFGWKPVHLTFSDGTEMLCAVPYSGDFEEYIKGISFIDEPIFMMLAYKFHHEDDDNYGWIPLFENPEEHYGKTWTSIMSEIREMDEDEYDFWMEEHGLSETQIHDMCFSVSEKTYSTMWKIDDKKLELVTH